MVSLKKKIIVAIDGYSSCGKSSFAKLIASELGYIHLDSGAMYRAVALFAIRKNLIDANYINSVELINSLSEIGISFINRNDESFTLLNGENVEQEIREVEVSSIASTISKIGEVREYLVGLQQMMGKDKGIVMDGRDIGTVVFPGAEIKIFMTASMEVRTKRRYDELKSKGIKARLGEVTENIKMRDEQDTTRKISPLRQAEDAILLDNSSMTFEEQMVWFEHILNKKNLLTV